jgi:hypothetical protein
MIADLSREQVESLLAYDAESGTLSWKVAIGSVAKGKVVTCTSSDGYLRVRINKRLYLAHRVIWLLMTGEWPEIVDHLDGDGKNNSWINLRSGSFKTNNENLKKAQSNSRTGLLGVQYREDRNGFFAEIKHNRKKVYLGSFPTAEEAHEAYLKAKRALHLGCTI